MGTFPPGEHRWSMDFFYPNPTNDFWRIMGLLYFGDKEALYDRAAKRFRLDDVRHLVGSHGIAMGDTGYKIRRLKGNASDKYLEILEPVDLRGLLASMPHNCYDRRESCRSGRRDYRHRYTSHGATHGVGRRPDNLAHAIDKQGLSACPRKESRILWRVAAFVRRTGTVTLT